ncbi:MAG: copper resistance protein B [Luteimonas sp.]|nr:copper resistance protein B [Luteimonas sp.]
MSTRTHLLALASATALAYALPALAQDHAHPAAPASPPACTAEHAAMGHCTLPATAEPAGACTPEHAAMGHCMLPVTAEPPEACTPEHAAMGHCTLPATAKPAEACTPEHASMGHCTLPATAEPAEACAPEHAAMGHCTPASAAADDDCPPEHAAMGHCTPRASAPTEPREPIPVLTDADRAAAFPPLRHAHMTHGPTTYSRTVFNRLEAWDGDHGNGQAWEASASIGGDLHRLWLRSEGEREGGRTQSSDLEVLYGRGITPWWDVVAGVKQDFRPAKSQTWAAIGVQGLAPYFFEVSATAYVGESGRFAASVEVEYEMLLTNRLILQPLVELEFNGKDDPLRHVGTGLTKAEAGLRLRYEVTRKFAPYVGVVHERTFGRTADYHVDEGEPARDTRIVAGVRVWF